LPKINEDLETPMNITAYNVYNLSELSSVYKVTYPYYSSLFHVEELPQQWKESIIVPIHKKGDKTDCNNYRGISLLSTAYEMISNIILARLTPYVSEVIGDHQCGFRRNRSTSDQIYYIR
jgi:hypothetical protein